MILTPQNGCFPTQACFFPLGEDHVTQKQDYVSCTLLLFLTRIWSLYIARGRVYGTLYTFEGSYHVRPMACQNFLLATCQPSQLTLWEHLAVDQNGYPSWNPSKWNQGLNLRSPGALFLTHTHLVLFEPPPRRKIPPLPLLPLHDGPFCSHLLSQHGFSRVPFLQHQLRVGSKCPGPPKKTVKKKKTLCLRPPTSLDVPAGSLLEEGHAREEGGDAPQAPGHDDLKIGFRQDVSIARLAQTTLLVHHANWLSQKLVRRVVVTKEGKMGKP